ncbi:MAG: HAD family hydrolase [Candidatus Bathyarchaeota archaeon]
MYLKACGKSFKCNLVIFDLDGTLIDSENRFLGLAEARVEALTRLVGAEVVRPWSEASGYDLEKGELDANGPLMRAPRREDLIVAATVIYAHGHRWGESKRLARLAYEEADKVFSLYYSPILLEGVESTLPRLRAAGLKLAIATNDRRRVADETMESLGMRDLFETVVGADDVEKPKPAPDMLLRVCEICGTHPSDTVFIGDLPQDMEAGRKAGIAGLIGVRSKLVPPSEMEGLADCLIDTFQELIGPPH